MAADLVVLDLYLSNAAYIGGPRRPQREDGGWVEDEMKGGRRRRRDVVVLAGNCPEISKSEIVFGRRGGDRLS